MSVRLSIIVLSAGIGNWNESKCMVSNVSPIIKALAPCGRSLVLDRSDYFNANFTKSISCFTIVEQLCNLHSWSLGETYPEFPPFRVCTLSLRMQGCVIYSQILPCLNDFSPVWSTAWAAECPHRAIGNHPWSRREWWWRGWATSSAPTEQISSNYILRLLGND